MKNQTYHHGDLRNALIEAGIELFNEIGINQFSLRKVASICGVSHTAPYSHFENKEDLIEAMKDYASNRFADALEQSIQNVDKENLNKQVTEMAKAYVLFFIENPRYYPFIFEQSDFDINLDDLTQVNGFRAFEVFRKLSVTFLEAKQVPSEAFQTIIIQMWALVHGIAGIAIMNGIQFNNQWDTIIEQILNENMR